MIRAALAKLTRGQHAVLDHTGIPGVGGGGGSDFPDILTVTDEAHPAYAKVTVQATEYDGYDGGSTDLDMYAEDIDTTSSARARLSSLASILQDSLSATLELTTYLFTGAGRSAISANAYQGDPATDDAGGAQIRARAVNSVGNVQSVVNIDNYSPAAAADAYASLDLYRFAGGINSEFFTQADATQLMQYLKNLVSGSQLQTTILPDDSENVTVWESADDGYIKAFFSAVATAVGAAGVALQIKSSTGQLSGSPLLVSTADFDALDVDLAGDVRVGPSAGATVGAHGLVSRSPDGTEYRLTPPNGGGAAAWVAV